jgi:hypothetical protein
MYPPPPPVYEAKSVCCNHLHLYIKVIWTDGHPEEDKSAGYKAKNIKPNIIPLFSKTQQAVPAFHS